MATMLRNASATRPATASRQRTVACSAGLRQAQIAGFSAMAAAALLVAPADAGVVLAPKELKKAFDAVPAVVATPSGKAAPKKVEVSTQEGLDPRSIALPGAIIFVGGLAFAASKADASFNDFLKYTLIKDNNEDGVGYENVIKSSAGGIYGPPVGSMKKASR